MKILSGLYKSRSVKTIQNASYRPTVSRVRKSLFDILGPLNGLDILDLFAGSGILGFEAMSRGGSFVTFIENNASSALLIQQNAAALGVECSVRKTDVIDYLQSCPQFDLIFADPPYGKIELQSLVELCLINLNNGGRLVLESSKHDAELSGGKIKQYGDTRLTFFTHE